MLNYIKHSLNEARAVPEKIFAAAAWELLPIEIPSPREKQNSREMRLEKARRWKILSFRQRE
jgi:hypothetical protein